MSIGLIMIGLFVGYIVYLYIYNIIKKHSKLITFSVVVYDSNGQWLYSKYVNAKSKSEADRKVNNIIKSGQTYRTEEL